jgi:hypothetical protein
VGCQPSGSELVQFPVDQRQELGGGLPVAGRGGSENASHVGHNDRVYPLFCGIARRTGRPISGRRELLPPGMKVAEATSGNTSGRLAPVAAVREYGLACVLPTKMSGDKRTALAVFGAFRVKPEQDRLYNIRNAINHGDVDADNASELLRIGARHSHLWMIVFGMLGLIIPIHRPLHQTPP